MIVTGVRPVLFDSLKRARPDLPEVRLPSVPLDEIVDVDGCRLMVVRGLPVVAGGYVAALLRADLFAGRGVCVSIRVIVLIVVDAGYFV